MSALEMFKQLQEATPENAHLTLASVFSKVFGRKLQTREWPILRRLVDLYGRDTVFWSILRAAHILDDSSVFSYISSICTNTFKVSVTTHDDGLQEKTQERIKTMRDLLNEEVEIG